MMRAAVVLMALVSALPTVQAQTCAAETSNFSQSADISMKKSDASCTAADGGYVKQYTTYYLHTEVTVTGLCRTYNPNNGSCVLANTYDRTAVSTAPKINGTQNGTIWGSSNVQHYNTCGNGNCTPVNTPGAASWTPFYTGSFVYTSTNIVGGGVGSYGDTDSRYCNMSGYTFPQNSSLTVNVLKCEPRWSLDSNGNIARLPPPTNHVEVFLDPNALSSASTALDAAISSWNNNVSNTGVTFHRASSSCGTGPDCITVQPVTSLGSCGYTPAATTDAGGNYVGSRLLQINANWSSWSSASLERTFAHELGHSLGLADYDTTSACDITGNSAIMQPNFSCGSSTDSPSTTVSINDYLPVNNTVYGGHSRLTCGF